MSPGCRRGTLRLASQAPTTQRFLRNVSSVSLNNEQALLRFGCPFFSHRVPGCRSHPAPHTHGLGDKKRINSAVFAEYESFHNVLVSPRPRVWAAADPRVVPTPLTKETSPRGGYCVSRNELQYIPLTLGSASSTQASVYLRASSGRIAMHGHSPSAQNRCKPRSEDTTLETPDPSDVCWRACTEALP